MNNIALLAFLIMSVGVLSAKDEEKDLQLKLETSAKTLRLGQSTNLQLKITGPEISEITKNTEGFEANLVNRSSFINKFRFKPQREGKFTFGPYSISVNGQKLNSNVLEIFVLPQWDGEYGTFFRVNKESIVLGEEIELVVETWSQDSQSITIFPDRNESYSVRFGVSSSHSTSAGETRINCNSRTFFITPTQSGVFNISREMFSGFPEDIDPPNIHVEVKEPSQHRIKLEEQSNGENNE
jgi:hypothetical protein